MLVLFRRAFGGRLAVHCLYFLLFAQLDWILEHADYGFALVVGEHAALDVGLSDFSCAWKKLNFDTRIVIYLPLSFSFRKLNSRCLLINTRLNSHSHAGPVSAN